MLFTNLVSAHNRNTHNAASEFLPRLDRLQEMYNQLAREHPTSNHHELSAIKILRRHASDIVEGRTTLPINAEELILAQQELYGIKQFMNTNQILALMTRSDTFSSLTEGFRKISTEYEAMIDALIDNRALFASYQPSPQRSVG